MPLRLALFALALAACAPRTGLQLEVLGPKQETSIAAGIVQLELVTSHASYCQRWVSDQSATGRHFDVVKRDLTKSPLHILVEPDHLTNLADAVRALVLARNASGQVVGVASFDPHLFRFEKVDAYAAAIVLFGDSDTSYVADDGCVCIPGLPYIGNGTQTGCDLLLPPSFARLTDTAGCELPQGQSLPLDVCDGQLYPGELQNRAQACYRTRTGSCRLGQRTCTDTSGRGLDGECAANDATLALPSGALCDAFSACQQTACGDPIACLKTSVPDHHKLRCRLPVAPDAKDGALAPCGGGSWSVTLVSATGSACVAAMLDGTKLGPTTLGFVATGQDKVQLVSAACPPTLMVDGVALSDPAALPASASFTISIGDVLYDVELDYAVECGGEKGDDLHCDLL